MNDFHSTKTAHFKNYDFQNNNFQKTSYENTNLQKSNFQTSKLENTTRQTPSFQNTNISNSTESASFTNFLYPPTTFSNLPATSTNIFNAISTPNNISRIQTSSSEFSLSSEDLKTEKNFQA